MRIASTAVTGQVGGWAGGTDVKFWRSGRLQSKNTDKSVCPARRRRTSLKAGHNISLAGLKAGAFMGDACGKIRDNAFDKTDA